MAANDYKPVSWNGEQISNSKLNQMCNNTQFLFERTPRIRYSGGGITRDAGVKVLSGKTPYAANPTQNWQNILIYFGSFFTAGCKPVITTTVETTGGAYNRSKVVIQGHGGEVDHTGFKAILSGELTYKSTPSGGWIHWTAVGY